MDEQTILDSITKWKDISHNGPELLNYLAQGSCIFYTYYNVHQSHEIHAYPGIYEDKLYFFMIPAAYDNEAHKDTFSNYTEVCLVSPVPYAGSHTIEDTDAMLRMERWEQHYESWVPKQAESEQGIFLAFNISVEDIEVPDVLINLALKVHPENESIFMADLIITNRTESRVYFDDYTTPVPPFSAVLTPQSFYLLQL